MSCSGLGACWAWAAVAASSMAASSRGRRGFIVVAWVVEGKDSAAGEALDFGERGGDVGSGRKATQRGDDAAVPADDEAGALGAGVGDVLALGGLAAGR